MKANECKVKKLFSPNFLSQIALDEKKTYDSYTDCPYFTI